MMKLFKRSLRSNRSSARSLTQSATSEPSASFLTHSFERHSMPMGGCAVHITCVGHLPSDCLLVKTLSGPALISKTYLRRNLSRLAARSREAAPGAIFKFQTYVPSLCRTPGSPFGTLTWIELTFTLLSG